MRVYPMICLAAIFAASILFRPCLAAPGAAQETAGGEVAGDQTAQEKDETTPGEADELEELLKEFEEEQEEASAPRKVDYNDPRYDFLKLGVQTDYTRSERFRLRDQILTFIPPLYQPAFLGHGYVLPPNAWRATLGSTFFDIGKNDFFKNGNIDRVHENHTVRRTRLDLDIFYGLDRDFTLRFNIPFLTSQSDGSVHPAGVMNMDLFVEGTTSTVGDATVFLKKKFLDQANAGLNFAGVIGVKFPNGSNDERFDQPMLVRDPAGMLGAAFGGGPFTRFTSDGRLPASLQPGTGAFGYIAGLFVTRQFTLHRSALHGGVLARFLGDDDGVEPGDELRFFLTLVKPVYKDYVSLELAVNGLHKQADSYDGMFMHPVPDPATGLLAGVAVTPRPAFQEGTVVFATPSLIIVPNPWLRFTISGLFRLNDPDLGPWPDTQVRFSSTVTF